MCSGPHLVPGSGRDGAVTEECCLGLGVGVLFMETRRTPGNLQGEAKLWEVNSVFLQGAGDILLSALVACERVTKALLGPVPWSLGLKSLWLCGHMSGWKGAVSSQKVLPLCLLQIWAQAVQVDAWPSFLPYLQALHAGY